MAGKRNKNSLATKNFPVITFPGPQIGLVHLANFEINAFTLAKIFELVFSTKIDQCSDWRSKSILRKAMDILIRTGEMEHSATLDAQVQTDKINEKEAKEFKDLASQTDAEEAKDLKEENEKMSAELKALKSKLERDASRIDNSSQTDAHCAPKRVENFTQTEMEPSHGNDSRRAEKRHINDNNDKDLSGEKIRKTLDEFRKELKELRSENDRLKIKVQNDQDFLITNVRTMSAKESDCERTSSPAFILSDSVGSNNPKNLDDADADDRSSSKIPENGNEIQLVDISSDEDEASVGNTNNGEKTRRSPQNSQFNVAGPFRKKCTLCKIKLFNHRQYRSHVHSEFHRENVRKFSFNSKK